MTGLLTAGAAVLATAEPAQAADEGCGYADSSPDNGAYASTICWFDFAAFDETQARTAAGQPMEIILEGGYVARFDVKVTDVPGTVRMSMESRTTPLEQRFAFGTDAYRGVPGENTLYSLVGFPGDTMGANLTFDNIEVLDSQGSPVTGYSFVAADTEDNVERESFTWTSDQPLTEIERLRPDGGWGCKTPVGNGTTQITCAGTGAGGSTIEGGKSTVLLVAADTPNVFTTQWVTHARSGIAIGIQTAKVTVTKTIADRWDADDSFDVSITSPEGALLGEASTGASNSATTGGVTVLPRSNGAVYTLGETITPGSSTDLGDYTTAWNCFNLTPGSTTALPSGDGATKTVAPAIGDDIRCEIVNTAIPFYDFGDAPATYGTTIADNGPQHRIPEYDADTNTAPIMLGSRIDAEEDGQPSDLADGDDTNGIADEDGVAFNSALNYAVPTIRTGLDPVSLQPVQNTLDVTASADGFVSVWVDWNQDGVYTDDERVANAQPVTAGTNAVSFSRGDNPDGISSFVRVRYSTDAASISTPTGLAPDGEVEDYRVLFERLVTPDVCIASGNEYYSFTFSAPVDITGTGGVGSSARYQNVTVINGVAVDMLVEVIAGNLNPINTPPNGFGILFDDDARWQVRSDATIRYTFVEAGTTTPIEVNAVFTVNDMDGAGRPERATFTASDLAGYAVTEGSLVGIEENGDTVSFVGSGLNDGTPESRFQFLLEGQSTFDVAWQGTSNAGFAFDGDGDLSIDPPACSDYGDAPDSYGTTLASDGARHQIVPGLTLGTLIDFDADGQPSDDASGDDENRLADEDGVAEPIVVTVGTTTSVTVSATNNTGSAATIAGWIDLDGNGTFDAAELVTASVPANSGTADYVLTFPAGTVTDDTFARFRLFPGDVTAFSPIGAATAGEVEDYPVTVLERELEIEKSSTMSADSRQGDAITYTVTATNIGPGAYTAESPAFVADSLAGVLDDATYNGDVVATIDGDTVGAPVFSGTLIQWTGALAAGETVTLTYTVTLTGAGDGVVRNVAWAPNVPPGTPPTPPVCDPVTDGADPVTGEPCAVVENELPRLTVAKTADVTELPADGGVVTYTVVLTNAGPGDYTTSAPARVTDDLSEVLDDAEFGEIVSPATGAAFDAEAEELTWSGPLAAGESATIEYTVTYDATSGNNVLYNVACVPEGQQVPGTDRCDNVRIPGAELEVDKSVNPANGTAVTQGQTLTYTLTFTSTGEAAAAVDKVDDLSDVLDDATLVVDSITVSADDLDATLTGTDLAITGSVPAGETITVTYQVTVNAFAEQGNHILANVVQNPDGGCEIGGCPGTENPIRHFSVTKTADPTEGVQTGDVVTYTVTVINDGAAAYTGSVPAGVSDDLSDVLDDATFNNDADAVASDESFVQDPTFAAPILTWSGPVAVGESVEITYSVTVTNLGNANLLNTVSPVCVPTEICDPSIPPVEILLPRVTPSKTSDPATGSEVTAGQVVTYTLSFTNDGQAAGPVDATDDLSDVLDDAELTDGPDVSTDGITAVFDEEAQIIRVEGNLAAGATVTVTYQVAIRPDGERGNNTSTNILTPDVPPTPEFPPPTTEHIIGELDDWKTVDPASGTTVRPGQVMTYTLHFQNTGAAPVIVDREDVLTQVLDDATVTTAPTSSDPALTVSAIENERFSISGSLAPGQLITVTYQVTVNADGARGDDRLGNFLVNAGDEPPAECVPVDDERPDCTVNYVSFVVATKSANPASGSAVNPGQNVTYTLTFRNVSSNANAAAAPIDYTDHMVDVLDDATLAAGPTTSDAAVSAAVAGNTIRVTGAVSPGTTVTVAYTVTVKAYEQQGNHQLGNVLAIAGEAPVCSPGSNLCTTHTLPKPAPLAITGGDVAWWTVISALILLAGGSALMMIRRRRSEEPTQLESLN